MNKIYQTIIDENKGNCMQAVIASLLNKKNIDEVPNFIEFNEWFEEINNYIKRNGYHFDGMLHNEKW